MFGRRERGTDTGTRNVVDAALDSDVVHFVGISTDKAVRQNGGPVTVTHPDMRRYGRVRFPRGR